MGGFFLKEPKGILPCAMKRRNPHSGCYTRSDYLMLPQAGGSSGPSPSSRSSTSMIANICHLLQGHLSSPFRSSVSSSSSNSDIFSPKMYNKTFNTGCWVHLIELAFQFLVNTMLHHNSDKKMRDIVLKIQMTIKVQFKSMILQPLETIFMAFQFMQSTCCTPHPWILHFSSLVQSVTSTVINQNGTLSDTRLAVKITNKQ